MGLLVEAIMSPVSNAIVDRLTFGSNILETGTESYRLTHNRELHR
ncbi:hypothetical protein [Kribbella sp. NBC_00359]